MSFNSNETNAVIKKYDICVLLFLHTSNVNGPRKILQEKGVKFLYVGLVRAIAFYFPNHVKNLNVLKLYL